MKIFIEPNDVLMFRDGKPFSAGDDHYARGIFPPFPSTFYGAIRSKILSEKYPHYESFSKKFKKGELPDDIKEEFGTPLSPGSLTIANFLLAKKENKIIKPTFPVPKDMVKIKGEKEQEFFLLKPEKQLIRIAQIKSNLPITSLTPLWLKSEKPIEEVHGFISLEMMNKYLQGDAPEEIISSDELYRKDERVGIKKDRTRKSAAAGALYSVEYLRLKEGMGFVVELSGVKNLPKKGLLRLGGDHRSAFYSESSFPMPDIETAKQKVKEAKHFKLLLLTPAIFDKSWIPDWINPGNGEGMINGISLQMISASIGRPVHIGGFDLVNESPKDMKRAVPAGSVYYFEIKQGNVAEIFNTFWLKSISTEKQHEGFGIAIIGGY